MIETKIKMYKKQYLGKTAEISSGYYNEELKNYSSHVIQHYKRV